MEEAVSVRCNFPSAGAVASLASRRLAPPPQCQALEAKAEELSSPPGGWVGRGGDVPGPSACPLWAAMAVLANTHGGVRCSKVSSSSPKK